MLGDNLLAFYKLDNNVNDETGNHNGILHSATSNGSGLINSCYDTGMIGTTVKYLALPDSLRLAYNNSSYISTSIWFKINQLPDNFDKPVAVLYNVYTYATYTGFDARIIKKRSLNDNVRYDIQISCRSRYTDAYSPTEYILYDGTSPSTLLNQWFHLVAVHDLMLNNDKIYFNGIYRVTENKDREYTAFLTYNATQPHSLGTNTKNTDAPFYGQIDEVGFWNRKLDANDVSELYQSGIGLSYPFILNKVNIGDSWILNREVKINLGDTWRTVKQMKINKGGNWVDIF